MLTECPPRPSTGLSTDPAHAASGERTSSRENCGELALRICGTARDGQTLRLQSSKCTIGGSPRCTLRLLAAGVRGVHCLLVRTANGAAVRAWSRDTRLNGRRFTDAALAVGDRLGIGSVELEVLSLGGDELASGPSADETQVAIAAPPMSVEPSTAGAEVALTEQRILSATREEFEALHRQLAAQQQSLADVQRTLAGQAAELVAQLQHLQPPARDDQSEEVRAHAAALDRGLAELDARRRELQSLGEQMLAEKAELEAERRAFVEEHSRWQSQQAERMAALPDESPSSERSDSEIFARLQRLVESNCQQSAPVEESWPSDPAAVPPGPQYRDEATYLSGSMAETGHEAESLAERRREARRAASEAEEQSIEEYMQQLLHRVRGGSAAEREAPRVEPAAIIGAAAEDFASEPEAPAVPEPARVQLSLKDIAPRSLAPEKADLAAMRDLANSQVRLALQAHQIQNTLRAVRGKWAIAAVGLAAAMFTVSFAPEDSTLLRLAAMMSLLVALFWGFQAWMSTQKAKDATAVLRPLAPAPPAAGPGGAKAPGDAAPPA